MPSRLLTPAALVLLTLLAYANSFSAGFPLDNKGLILDDVRVHHATSANLDLIVNHTYWWPYGESGLYRPVTTLSYMLNYAVLGNATRPAGYHWFNLTLHAINTLLAYLLVRRFVAGAWESVAIAAVWTVLPLSTEAVTNIVGRADLLAAAAVLGGLLCYLASRDATGIRRGLWLAALAGLTMAGVFSKESAVAVVFVIALHEAMYWSRGQSLRALMRAATALAVPLFVMWQQRAIVLSASPAAEWPFVDNPMVGAGFWVGRLTAVKVIARYLWLVVWPVHLSADYSFNAIALARGSGQDWLAWICVAAIVAVIVALAKRQRTVCFFAAFAFVTLLPSSNLVVLSGTIMAERLMYLPSLGVVAALVLLTFAGARTVRSGMAPLAALAIVVAVFTVRTRARSADWVSDATLWTSAVLDVPNSYKAHEALAEALYETDPSHANIDRVIDEAERAVAILAPLPEALTSLHALRQAAAYFLDKAEALNNANAGRAAHQEAALAAYQRAQGLLTKCLTIIEVQTASRPGAGRAQQADINRLLAAAYLGLDDPARAMAAADTARRLEPINALGYRLSAETLVASDRAGDAAIALMVGSMVTSDRSLTETLLSLYRSGLDQQRCAIATTAGGAALNPACGIVHEHVCAATTEAITIDLGIGRVAQAEQFKATAIGGLGCAAKPILDVLPDRR